MRAFDLPCLEQMGFEADDLIATYARQACEAGATVTIVSSDKDLMQLVNDCVIMYDTMKDKKIGIAEVIEKFGVPPEKVIEVQALIGDSTDNVPGVPGIGVKTAAQLIGEYGDLETLLARAGEIKQEKRRQTLIDNAEKARLSKKLVTLDDKVTLDVPLADLAVHEPDHKQLIAFLKAMEFTTLTRRVAEFADIDVGQIEPDGEARHGERGDRPPRGRIATQRGRLQTAPCPLSGGAMALPKRPGAAAAAGESEMTPQGAGRGDDRRRRAEFQFDRSRYAIRAHASTGSTPGSRAPSTSALSRSQPRARASIRCRPTLCGIVARARAERGLLHPARASQGGDGGAEGLFAGGIAPDQISEQAALDALQAAARGSRRAQDRAESEVRVADVRAARHRTVRPTTTRC